MRAPAGGRRESFVRDDLDGLGGPLTCSPEKQAHHAVESEARLGHGDAVPLGEAEGAVRGFSDPDDPNRTFGDPAGAPCDRPGVRTRHAYARRASTGSIREARSDG
ncbi:hypothetical protein [Streptomyces sp. NRRL S-37]|uniref:hypothetical protein n=1 Tax=Streptomyces sp. NRRL S-37 TaxID=1463903 RepID=UPI0004CB47B5|nr:hypothetical protein [Streptomyces sp. NRRL S-37]